MSKTVATVTKLAEPIVEEEGLELVDVEYVKEGADYYLRVFIDRKDTGVGLEECEIVSNRLSEKLDEVDPIPGSYILEVSSPGIERPLKKLEDFDRFQGRLAYVKTFVAIDGLKEFTGIIQGREDEKIQLLLKDSDTIIEIPYSGIAKARLAVEF
ncbi:MAG TPA: ribosome maturation factor RimP [Halanaerobiaceae bacterium]|mgnify:CR=1 FL=1|jgi:ribosome maturation factor RimP|nr:ribosome maturation factor RimP [Bacillota bacterium]HHU91695.1 ribosome maturation factor RimP [Halanaerobiaceae bacterium]HOA40424.1 ribosome maturation factor RimP [Halanaerobiales bacterium]HPZ62570.1 ribosome maturation factor RimP [Halanaerobiales bacterium]HQD03134.1 ribosome maturation factor RimP [Halanaerobiales bacterium]